MVAFGPSPGEWAAAGQYESGRGTHAVPGDASQLVTILTN